MRQLRCCGPRCSILSKAARLEYELDLLAGRCLCREAVERMDKRKLSPIPVSHLDHAQFPIVGAASRKYR